MFTRDVDAFSRFARDLPADFGAPVARGVLLVSPDGFARADDSARDNRYMQGADRFDARAAMREHRLLHEALAADLPVACFRGDAAAPDGLFPNNVFATTRRPSGRARAIVGRMRYPVRRLEAARADIRAFLAAHADGDLVDLSRQPHPCELTGSLVIDRARGIGFCGLSERCDGEGARLMHDAFGLRATLAFDLAPGEYHANVVLAILAGRAAVVAPDGFADPRVPRAIAALYAPHACLLSPGEHAAFAANAISLATDAVWMARGAERALAAPTRAMLAEAGFSVRTLPLEAIEAAGGSLRCCVAELF
ncbi:arginine deiminase-related protein [Luteimonas pelagia]